MMTYFLLALTGAFAGTLGGMFGIGGGVVIVPVLYLVFTTAGADPEVAMKTAVGTSLATIIVTSLVSLRAHHRRGAVDMALLRRWGPFIGLGAIAGAGAAWVISGEALLLVFALGVIAIAIQRLTGSTSVAKARSFPPWLERASGLVTGFFSALMGIGGGVIGVVLLTMTGETMHRAVGTASGFGVAIAVPGALAFAVLGLGPASLPGAVGFIHGPAFAAIALGTLIFTPLGAGLAHRLSAKRLSSIFGVYLMITGAVLLREALLGLS